MTNFLRTYKYPLLIAAIAVIVRWIYLIELSAHPGFTVPMVDEKWHWQWALDIIHNSFLGDGTWFRAPLYPYFLAFLAFITSESIFWAKFLQLVLAGGTAFFLVRLGDHLFGRTAGIIAGLIYAFYGTLLYYEAMFLIPIVFLFFLVWGMFRLIAYSASDSWRTWLLTGAVFGLAAISRPNVLLIIPLLMLWVFYISPRRKAFLIRLRRPAILLAGLILVILPVTARNLAVTGDFILISSQGGVNFYLGNNKLANGLTMRMGELELSESLSWDQFQPATHEAAERLAGRSLTEAEASDFWTQRAVTFITENPGEFLGLLWRKTIYLFSGFENSDNSDIYYERGKSTLYSLLLWDGPIDFPWGLLLPLTLAGIYLRRKDTGKLLPIYLFLLGYIPTIILFLVTARHRLPMVPFMVIIASAGIVKAIDLVRRKRYRDLTIGGLIFLAALILFNRTWYEEGGRNDFQIHFNEGIKQEHLGNYAKAEQEYLAANRYFSESPALLTNLGHVRYELGKIDSATLAYERALRINPTFHRALNNLGLVLMNERDNIDSALTLFAAARTNYDSSIARPNELGLIYMNLGKGLETFGRADVAVAYFDSAVRIAPTSAEVSLQAAAFFARNDYHELADSMFIRGQSLAEPVAADYFNWGLSFIQRQRYSDGVYMLDKALSRDSTLYQAHYLTAVAYYEGGMPPDSVQDRLNKALRFNPNYEPALKFREHISQ